MIRLSRREALLVAGAGLLVPWRSAFAHHGWGSYDAEKPLELSGRIAAMSYEWPHAEMRLAVGDKNWEVVLGPPTRTRSRGLTDDRAKVGTDVTVMGYPHRTRESEIRVEWVRVAGDTYQMR